MARMAVPACQKSKTRLNLKLEMSPRLLFGRIYDCGRTCWGLSSNGTEMYAKGVDRYLPEMRLRRIQE